ncbi:ATP-binding protein [Andreprevotia chitinilytica]|uniref:ATP-binding protein n=1 Tax=Andreprevotia chitinilytica TaxID=396808 RepID=UPI00068F62F6|nr:ATP-binding protein [Andreprevotia chitinilytica]
MSVPDGVSLDYQAIFERGHVLYLILKPDAPRFTILGASDIYLQTTRRTREELVGQGVFEAFPVSPEDNASDTQSVLRASLERVVSAGQPDGLPVYKYDIPLPEAEGGGYTIKYWSVVSFPVLDDAGQLIHIALRVEDITELVQLRTLSTEQSKANDALQQRTGQMEQEVLMRAQEIKDANVRLASANDELDRRGQEVQALYDKLKALDVLKTQFFANISHEFRTPLTLILGPVEEALADPQQLLHTESLEAVHRNAQRLLRLVNSLLDFARIEASRLQMSFAPTDLAALTTDLASSFRSLVERAGMQLVVDCPPLPERVYVDVALWEKIVLNLVSNAFKFTLQGEITVALRWRDDRVELVVRDTGCGIPETELPHMFERFHRIEGAHGRSFEGSGIGLSLVHEFAKLHGGDVRVSSLVGQGSVFTVVIPTGCAHLPAEHIANEASATHLAATDNAYLLEAMPWLSTPGGHAEGETPPAAQVAAMVTPARILVADDNADMRAYLTRILSARWRVDVAEDGGLALALARANRPDLILSDVMMPRMDGIALLRELRADAQTRDIPVVLLSARAGEESLLEGIGTGADDYLVKPFSARELLARVQTHLGMALQRREWAKELERANVELEAFSYSVSHDLRTPLRAVDGFSKVLLDSYGDRLDEEGRHFLVRVRTATQRMGALIDDLLNLSRITRAPLKRELIDVSGMARHILDELAEREPYRRVEIEVATALVSEADCALLKVLLENLLANAWKYSSKRSQSRIEVGLLPAGEPQATGRQQNGAQAGDGPVFFVRDNGAGFDMAHARKLFSPFHRLHAASEFEGTGIGLATVQRIVARHGGRVWAEAAKDAGATFYFTLGGVQ